MKLSRGEFERLALEQIDMLGRVALALTRDSTRAEDLVQETYLHAIRAADRFDMQDHGLRPWLLRILHNLHYSQGRRNKRQPLAVDDELLQQVEDRPASPTLELLADQTLDERLSRALQALAPEYETVLMLWAIEEMSYKEIADAIDVPLGTVMSRLHRARQKLAERLQDLARDRGIIRK